MKKHITKAKTVIYNFIKADGLSAVVSLMVIIVFIAVTKDIENLFELSFFSSILFAIILERVTHLLGHIIMNRLEDSMKLTTDYEQLMKKYPKANWYEYAGERFPITFEGWIKGSTIQINDMPDVNPYELPDLIKDNFNEIIAAHDTSATYNSLMIRVNDWNVSDNIFTLDTARTTYYNSLVTNRAMDYKWSNGMTIRDLFGYGPFISSLKESKLSNHLGFNGFVESSDGYIVFVKRSDVPIGKRVELD